MLCCALFCVHFSFVMISMGMLVALLCLSSCCLMIVVWLFLTIPWVCLQFVIVVFPDHTHLLFMTFHGKIRLLVNYFLTKSLSEIH